MEIVLARVARSRSLILAALSDGKPKCHREIVKAAGLKEKAVWEVLFRSWKKGLVLRTKKPIFESVKIFRGRAGVSRTTRPYHLYVLRPDGMSSLNVNGYEFAEFRKEYLDARGGRGKSKASPMKSLRML